MRALTLEERELLLNLDVVEEAFRLRSVGYTPERALLIALDNHHLAPVLAAAPCPLPPLLRGAGAGAFSSEDNAPKAQGALGTMDLTESVRSALRVLDGIACWNLVARPGHADYVNRAGIVARAALAYADLQRAAMADLPDAALASVSKGA